MPSLIEQAIDRSRANLLAGETAAVRDVLAAYADARARLMNRIAALAEQLEDAGDLTASEALRLGRARELLAQIDAELVRLGLLANGRIAAGQASAVQMAGDQAFALAYLSAASASPAVAASLSTAWSRVNTGAVEAMVGRLSDGSPLSEWLSQWGDESAQAIRRELIRGISLGTNPRGIAARLEKQTDIAGARLLTLTRSTVLDTYRTTTLENYRANRDLGAEWEWISAQDARCCLSCLFLDGRRFPLDVRFQPCHLNCRCSSIFVLDGIGTPPRQFASEWFDGQPEATQRQMIPATAWDDFNAGRLTLGDFNVLERDARWGDRYRQSTVSEARANAARRDRMAA